MYSMRSWLYSLSDQICVMAIHIYYFTSIHKTWQIFQPSFSLRRFSTHFHWDIHIILETFIYKNNLHNRIFSNQQARDLNSSLKPRSKLYRQNNERSCFVDYLNIFQQTCGFNSKIYMCFDYNEVVLVYFNSTSCSKNDTVSHFIVYKILMKSSASSNQLRLSEILCHKLINSFLYLMSN